jgi:hypothetical protein
MPMLLKKILHRLATRTRFPDNSMLGPVSREAYEYTNSSGEQHVFDVYSEIQGGARTFIVDLSTITKKDEITERPLMANQLLRDEIRAKCEEYFALRGWHCYFI